MIVVLHSLWQTLVWSMCSVSEARECLVPILMPTNPLLNSGHFKGFQDSSARRSRVPMMWQPPPPPPPAAVDLALGLLRSHVTSGNTCGYPLEKP